MTTLSSEPVEVRPTELHRQTGAVLHELGKDQRQRNITDHWGRPLAVLLHPDDPRLRVTDA